MSHPPEKVSALPTKEFFVHMITRDVTLEDCILDLIDNSVDSAWKQQGSPTMRLSSEADLSPFTIDIVVTDHEFSVSDTCGGMSRDDALTHAFTFGRLHSQTKDDYSIGVYGIGMKRAAFKLGEHISVKSTSLTATGQLDSFAVQISVPTWLADTDPNWTFDLLPADALKQPGVRMKVTKLTPTTAQAFHNPTFGPNLERLIARDYMLHLNRGLTIRLNNQPIRGRDLRLRTSGDFRPLRLRYIDTFDSDVAVEVIAGMASQPPDTAEPSEDDRRERPYGWYIACNGRLILAADKTQTSGWGTPDWPLWHPQYSGFIGIVHFTSKDTAKLPLTTTKRNVDASSAVYKHAQNRMRTITRQWTAYTNLRKQELDAAKAREASTQPVDIYAIKTEDTLGLPRLQPAPREQIANVHYSVPLIKMRELADGLGNINMTYREVGIRSFDHTYDEYVDDS